MSAEECISTTARLSRRLSVDITLLKNGEMFVVWDPDVPKSLTKREKRLYENARNQAFQKFAANAGMGVLVVSL